MSLLTEHTTLMGAFQTQFVNPPVPPATTPTEFLPVQWPNKPRPDTAAVIAWVRFSILDGETKAAEVGASRTRTYGVIMVECYVRENEGTRPARTAYEKCKTIFNYQRFILEDGDILMRQCQFKTLAAEAGWSRHSISVPFQRDERSA